MTQEFTYIDSHETKGEVFVWTRDEAGVTIHRHDSSEFQYCFIPDNSNTVSGFKDMWGTPMKKCSFENKWQMREFAESEDYVCESDVQTKYRCLVEKYHEASETFPVNFCLYDIEVDFDLNDGLGYPKPENPHGEINLIQCWDNHRNQYTVFLMDHLKGVVDLKDEDYPVEMVYCWSERDMLERFAIFLNPIDLFSAWFGAGFDLPYIIERALVNFDKEKALTMFCRDGFKATRREFVNGYGEDAVAWQTVGRKHVDMMEIYKKFIPGQRESFSLDAIAREDLGMEKVQYEDEGDLGYLYRSNPQKFCEYGLHDARLLLKLNEKHNLVAVAVGLAVQSSVTYDDVVGSVKPIEMSFMEFCRDKGNIVLPDKKGSDAAKFPGAIVYETRSGRHGWVTSADLAGLYPSVIIMLGLSPETVVGQLVGEYDDYVEVMGSSEAMVEFQEKKGSTVTDVYEVKASDLKKVIDEMGYTVSANGTIFDGSLGLIAEYIQQGVDRRNDAKGKAKEFFGVNDAEHQRFDLLQKVLKIRNNSAYGCISNQHFRLFDINLAASITITGQMISKFQAVAANDEVNMMKEVLNAG